MNEDRLIQALEKALVKKISSGEVFEIPYNERIDVSQEMKIAYRKINHESLQKKITERLEEALAKKIVDKVITEMGTDIKKLMCNETIRDDFRFLLRTGVEKILEKIREEK